MLMSTLSQVSQRNGPFHLRGTSLASSTPFHPSSSASSVRYPAPPAVTRDNVAVSQVMKTTTPNYNQQTNNGYNVTPSDMRSYVKECNSSTSPLVLRTPGSSTMAVTLTPAGRAYSLNSNLGTTIPRSVPTEMVSTVHESSSNNNFSGGTLIRLSSPNKDVRHQVVQRLQRYIQLPINVLTTAMTHTTLGTSADVMDQQNPNLLHGCYSNSSLVGVPPAHSLPLPCGDRVTPPEFPGLINVNGLEKFVLKSPQQPLCIGARCNHISHWRRLRGKKGFAYYDCSFCGMRWRFPSRGNTQLQQPPLAKRNGNSMNIETLRVTPPSHPSAEAAETLEYSPAGITQVPWVQFEDACCIEPIETTTPRNTAMEAVSDVVKLSQVVPSIVREPQPQPAAEGSPVHHSLSAFFPTHQRHSSLARRSVSSSNTGSMSREPLSSCTSLLLESTPDLPDGIPASQSTTSITKNWSTSNASHDSPLDRSSFIDSARWTPMPSTKGGLPTALDPTPVASSTALLNTNVGRNGTSSLLPNMLPDFTSNQQMMQTSTENNELMPTFESYLQQFLLSNTHYSLPEQP